MMRMSFETITRRAWPCAPFLLGLLLLLPACKTEEIIVEVPPWEPPPTEAAGYMGYRTSEAANVSKQSAWVLTAHADAWNGLQSSGGAQEFCEGCHTDNQLGNPETEEGGWLTTGDERYYDVQCENCHGPGETHANNPESSNIPLASLAVDLESGCGECHAGAHHPFVEQWEDSPHSDVVASASTRESCFPCHRGQGTLIAWGENANYVEKFSEEALPVVCGVCHDPHGEAMFEGQLSFPVNTTSSETHLCSKCHNRRPLPEGQTSRGPHAPESAL
ncbi:MAG: cytochrome c3 family protein, partial [Planctomycetota bacterium]